MSGKIGKTIQVFAAWLRIVTLEQMKREDGENGGKCHLRFRRGPAAVTGDRFLIQSTAVELRNLPKGDGGKERKSGRSGSQKTCLKRC